MLGQVTTFQSLPSSLKGQEVLLRDLMIGSIFRGYGINPCLQKAYQQVKKDGYALSAPSLSSLIDSLYETLPVVHPMLILKMDAQPKLLTHSTAGTSLSSATSTPTLEPIANPTEFPQGEVAYHEVGFLMAALAVYFYHENEDFDSVRKRGIEISGYLPGWGERSEKISIKSIKRLEDGTLTDRIYRSLWKGLFLYFRIKASDPKNSFFEEAKFWEMTFWMSICTRNGWKDDLFTPEGRLLALARHGVALSFGGRLPCRIGIPGVPNQRAASPLTRWLQGEPVVFGPALPKERFWTQVRALLTGLGGPRKSFEADLKLVVSG